MPRIVFNSCSILSTHASDIWCTIWLILLRLQANSLAMLLCSGNIISNKAERWSSDARFKLISSTKVYHQTLRFNHSIWCTFVRPGNKIPHFQVSHQDGVFFQSNNIGRPSNQVISYFSIWQTDIELWQIVQNVSLYAIKQWKAKFCMRHWIFDYFSIYSRYCGTRHLAVLLVEHVVKQIW